jgi:hypothetical protein
MIITLTSHEINIDIDNFSCNLESEVLNKLVSENLSRKKTASYKLFINNRELRLVCPLLKNEQSKNVVIWPSFKLPFRKYPVYVYLYAVALYLSSDLSMRNTASFVRNAFRLDKFSHSTISRALKKLSTIVDTLSDIISGHVNNNEEDKKLVERKNWDTDRCKKYNQLLSILVPVLDKGKMIQYGSFLNYIYFNNSLKFVI